MLAPRCAQRPESSLLLALADGEPDLSGKVQPTRFERAINLKSAKVRGPRNAVDVAGSTLLRCVNRVVARSRTSP